MKELFKDNPDIEYLKEYEDKSKLYKVYLPKNLSSKEEAYDYFNETYFFPDNRVDYIILEFTITFIYYYDRYVAYMRIFPAEYFSRENNLVRY